MKCEVHAGGIVFAIMHDFLPNIQKGDIIECTHQRDFDKPSGEKPHYRLLVKNKIYNNFGSGMGNKAGTLIIDCELVGEINLPGTAMT